MQPLLTLDHRLIDQTPGLEHPALTAVFVVLSAWWVKGPLLVALALGTDLWRRRIPVAVAATAAAALTASLVINALKETFDRARPPTQDSGLPTLVATPDSASFPSGHARMAFAAAASIAVLCPRLRWPAVALAGAVGLSRIYLRVHFPLDVVAGAALGGALGTVCGVCALRLYAPASAPTAT
jgi:undecaprenyl-diphosphatase